jgi:hypothetical protein
MLLMDLQWIKITRHRKSTPCKGLGYDFNTVEFAVRDGILMLLILVILHLMLN